MKLIELHERWLKQGYIDYKNGLCSHMWSYIDTFNLFQPDYPNKATWWGYNPNMNASREDRLIKKLGIMKGHDLLGGTYTKFRQTIVLFICAMHGELGK